MFNLRKSNIFIIGLFVCLIPFPSFCFAAYVVDSVNVAQDLGVIEKGKSAWAFNEYETYKNSTGKFTVITTGVVSSNPNEMYYQRRNDMKLGEDNGFLFVNQYQFSLTSKSKLKIQMSVPLNYEDSMDWYDGKGKRFEFLKLQGSNNNLNLTIIDKNTYKVVWTKGMTNSLLEYADLESGNYTLMIAGRAGWIKDPNFTDTHMAYNLDMSAGDVPLPAGFVLLGTALLGGMAYRRRFKKQ